MERTELERELAGLHEESWGCALACCARDEELAEEALQAAYLRILSGRARFDGRSSLKTWVFGVVRRTAMEEARRRWSWRARTSDAEEGTQVADPTPGADAAAERSERSAALVAALAGISPRQREVLQLVFYNDLTIEDAAAIMGTSIGSARTHYERGKQALARKLRPGAP